MAGTYTQIYIQNIFAVEGRQRLIASGHSDELQKYITGIVSAQLHKLIMTQPAKDALDALKLAKAETTRNSFIHHRSPVGAAGFDMAKTTRIAHSCPMKITEDVQIRR